MNFRTPLRRKTRQRSGFNVAGNSPGSECKIKKSGRLNIAVNNFEIHFFNNDITIVPLFEGETGLMCFGCYLNPKENLDLNLTLKYKLDNVEKIETRLVKLYANQWNKVGILAETEIIKPVKINRVDCEFRLISETKSIGIIDFFGINLNAINYNYFEKEEVKEFFYEKMEVYIPEISYHNYDQISYIKSDKLLEFTEGEPIIIKSCNRCSRFLPIDVLHERNTLSFSNHCVKRVPCVHQAFSKYTIKESEYTIIPRRISPLINKGGKVVLHHGYQLECKSCKKFFVNAPLNPLRNSTQHREDSLRRRAIEILVDTLLKKEWIYHKFRLEHNREFDNFIWEKFGKKCFKCKKDIKDEHHMDLDHTMPLASFWPLDESATCLCKKCNSLKSDKFPIEFYSKEEIRQLSDITGLPIKLLICKTINTEVVEHIIDNIKWFFDEFLNDNDYQKIRDGKKASDLIYKTIIKQIHTFYDPTLDLVKIYKKKTGKIPKTITL